MAVSKVRTSAGTTFSISTAAISGAFTGVIGDYTGMSYIQVGELSDLGSFGKKYNLATFIPLADRKVVKRKASYNNGSLSLKLGSSVTDPGQIQMQAASTSDSSYAFKVVTQSTSTFYFTGQVMSWVLAIGSVDQIMGAECDVEIDNDIISGSLVA